MRAESCCRHKIHMNKVIAVCMVGFAFDGTPADGGTGVRIVFKLKRVFSKDRKWTMSRPFVRNRATRIR